MKRARQDHQKLERRDAILAVALALLAEAPFQRITMAQVAERAGLVKGTLYLYFTTKEELFLELLRDQFHGWFWDLEAGLGGLPRASRLEATARLVAETAARRPAFCSLLAVLHSHLEGNLPGPTALAFQRELLARTTAMGALLEQALPFLRQGQGRSLIFQVLALIVGLQSLPDFPGPLRGSVHALVLGQREANRG